ncbi:MAG: hypothetical protein WCK78_19440, partial [Paludibacter sp.]
MSIIVFLVGIPITKYVSEYFKTGFKRGISLYIWHTLFCFLYAWYVTQYGGDAGYYYFTSPNDRLVFSFGTIAIKYLTSFFSNILGLSFIATSLVYNIFGFIGLMAFDAALRYAVLQKKRTIRGLASVIVFLPSVSFWSAGIGKDSLAFMSAGLALWAALNFKQRVWIMIPSIIIMLFVRPHIAAILIISFTFSIIFQKRLSFIFRVGIGIIALITTILILPISLKYSKLENSKITQSLEKYIHQRASYNKEGGGSVDISTMPITSQVGTYLFRPFPFEAHSIPSFAASLDNMVLLYLFVWGITSMIKRRYISKKENRLFLWTYSLITLLILSTTTANLGISVRQKWMFTPMLIFLMIS